MSVGYDAKNLEMITQLIGGYAAIISTPNVSAKVIESANAAIEKLLEIQVPFLGRVVDAFKMEASNLVKA
jgi:hypothetical protein